MRDASSLVLETFLYTHWPLTDLATTGLFFFSYDNAA
jgi:hypothetical protein